jgi:hypothetical protein
VIQLDLDTLIERWRTIHAGSDAPWVLYEHGTCVCVPQPGADLLIQADALLAEWRVVPGTVTAGFSLKPARCGGWLVTCAQPWIANYVPAVAASAAAGAEPDPAEASALGQWGRSRRDRDARELGAIHVEDRRIDRDHRAGARAEAWGRLVRAAAAADVHGSDWRRFAIPLPALEPIADEDVRRAPPPLAELTLDPEVRELSETLESMTCAAERALRPFNLYAGLRSESVPITAAELSRRHPPGSHVALTGFLSASGRVRPPVYAAHPSGAMLVVKVQRAAPLPKPGDGPDEYEFLLPRDCRCRVIDVVAEGRFESDAVTRDVWSRPTLRLEQIDPQAD